MQYNFVPCGALDKIGCARLQFANKFALYSLFAQQKVSIETTAYKIATKNQW